MTPCPFLDGMWCRVTRVPLSLCSLQKYSSSTFLLKRGGYVLTPLFFSNWINLNRIKRRKIVFFEETAEQGYCSPHPTFLPGGVSAIFAKQKRMLFVIGKQRHILDWRFGILSVHRYQIWFWVRFFNRIPGSSDNNYSLPRLVWRGWGESVCAA